MGVPDCSTERACAVEAMLTSQLKTFWLDVDQWTELGTQHVSYLGGKGRKIRISVKYDKL